MYTSAQLDLYADDTGVTAFADVKKLATLSLSLNKSVSEIQLWASANKLPLNEDKTKVLTITGKRCVANINGSDIDVIVNGKQLSNVDCATLLGVEIDSKLSFNEHIEKVCEKLASRIAILRKIRACLPLKQRLQFFNSIIRPTSFPGYSLYLEKVPWLRLVTCLCKQTKAAQRAGPQLNFVDTV